MEWECLYCYPNNTNKSNDTILPNWSDLERLLLCCYNSYLPNRLYIQSFHWILCCFHTNLPDRSDLDWHHLHSNHPQLSHWFHLVIHLQLLRSKHPNMPHRLHMECSPKPMCCNRFRELPFRIIMEWNIMCLHFHLLPTRINLEW